MRKSIKTAAAIVAALLLFAGAKSEQEGGGADVANYHEEIVNIELETGNMHRSFLRHSIGEGDEQANRFGVRAYRKGVPENLTGTCKGYFVRADGATVTINNGVVSGNMAYVTLTEECYAIEGVFCLAIKIINGSEKVTLRIVDGIVSRTSTSIAVDPGTIIPSVETLIELIENAVESIPADYSTMTEAAIKHTENDIRLSDYDGYLFQYIDPNIYSSGYYKHDATTETESGGGLYYFPPVSVEKGKTYWHYDCRNYFSKIIYFDGTVEYFDSSDTQTSGTITAQKNGFAYISSARPESVLFTNKDVTGIGALEYGAHAIPFESVYPTLISASNYGEELPDLNTLINNKTYILNFADGSTSIPANYPYPSWHGKKTTINWLKAINLSNRFDTVYCTQILVTGNGEILFRYSVQNGVFSKWEEYVPQRHIYVEKDGSGDYTSLFSALTDAVKNKNTVVHVGPGTYDLISETGATWWETEGHYGLYLMNGVHVIFSPDSKVVFNYTGSEEWTLVHVSPFNSGEGGFTLENMTLEASRCRYPIHDERVVATDEYINRYINCNIKMDNRNNPQWSANQCIGGGLGTNGTIIIDGCIFESQGAPDHSGIVSWHNCVNDGKSRITVKNSLFVTGTFRFGYYGAATKQTEIIVTNCKMRDDPYMSQESPDYTNVNGVLYAWNNEIEE